MFMILLCVVIIVEYDNMMIDDQEKGTRLSTSSGQNDTINWISLSESSDGVIWLWLHRYWQ